MIAFFPVLGQIESRDFNFRRDPQADHNLHQVGDEGGAHNGQAKRNADGFELFDPKPALGDELGQAILRGGTGGLELVADIG